MSCFSSAPCSGSSRDDLCAEMFLLRLYSWIITVQTLASNNATSTAAALDTLASTGAALGISTGHFQQHFFSLVLCFHQ